MRAPFRPWQAMREHAGLHAGLILGAPPFWAAVSVFLSPVWGGSGFLLHSLLCLPRRRRAQAALLAAYPLFLLWFASRHPTVSLPSMPWHQTHAAEGARLHAGTVAGFPTATSAGGPSFLLQSGSDRLRVSLPPDSPAPRWGASILVTAGLEPPAPPDNPGQLDLRRVLRAQGASAFLRGEGWTELRPPPVWKAALGRLRGRLGESLRRHVPEPVRPLIAATLLNETEDLSPETREAFLRSGMQHIVAISGQHIGLLIVFLLTLGLLVRLPRKAAFLLAGVLTAVYVPVTGSPVSVARAGILLAFSLPAVWLERPGSGLNALSLTAAADLVLDPFNILNLGFQLSYAATLALILLSRPSRRLAEDFGMKRSWAAGGFQMVFLSLMVTVFTYPALAASTHLLAPWGILGNLVTVPLSGVMLVAGLLVWSFAFLPGAGFLAGAAGACAGLFSLLLEGSVFFLSRLPGAVRPIAEAPDAWLALLALSGPALAVVFASPRRRILGLLITALLVAAETARPLLSVPRSSARITFLAVGHGDAAVLELPGAVFLVDAGDSRRVAEQVLLPFLRSRGIGKVDALILTHPHRDHFGGASGLIQGVPVGAVIAPPVAGGSASWRCLRGLARVRGLPWKESRSGDVLYRGKGLTLTVLGPDSAAPASENDLSLVCLLEAPAGKILLTGDVEAPGQKALGWAWPLWRGAWLKAPHHGSDRTTLPCFLDAAAAPRALVSAGSRPGFPGPRTLRGLERFGPAGVTHRDGAWLWEMGAAAAAWRFRESGPD